MRAIKLDGGSKPAQPAPKKEIVFEDEADSRYGFYRAKESHVITRYKIPFQIEKGQKVEVIEDKGDRVLVHLDASRTIYCDSDKFFRDFERVTR
jgi:hypothetical protein